ncbi:MAG: DUF5677 domain-containing protein [bacterium]
MTQDPRRENKPLFGSKFFISETQNFLMAEMTMIRGIIKEKKLKGRALEISAMIFSLLSTGNAILELSKENLRFYNECVMLARSFFERMTNICYLLLCDEDTFKGCMHHTIFKQYTRRSDNSKVIKDENDNILMELSLTQKNTENLKKDMNLKDVIDKFKKSRRTRFPTPKIEKRLGFIAKFNEYLNVSLLLAYQLLYYDDASEALHGSFYGSLFHVLNVGSKNKNDIDVEINKNTALLLLGTGELIHQLVRLLHKDNDLMEFYEKSFYNSEGIHKKFKFALQKDVMV